MRTFWIVQAVIGGAGVAGFIMYQAACGGTIVGGPGTGTGSGTDPGSDMGTDPYTDTCTTFSCDDTGTGTGTNCYDCACVWKSGDTPAGCADTCDDALSGDSTPNYCNGAPVLSQCSACIAARCGVTDLGQCF